MKKLASKLFSILVVTALIFGGFIQAGAYAPDTQPAKQGRTSSAAPISPTDETKVPHYFGPYPNWANSPFRLPNVFVELVGGGGTGATAAATVDPQTGALLDLQIINPGSGYTYAPTVSITGSGTNAEATTTVDYSGVVNAINVATAGGGYTAPSVSISGGGATADATASVFGGVDAVIVSDPGQGYTFPTVEFGLPNDPAGTPAQGHAEMDANGSITAIVVDNAGSGYSAAPSVTIHDGTTADPVVGATLATASSTLLVQSVVLESFGAGYISEPAVVISDSIGAGAGATASATLSKSGGAVTGITLTNPGSGYMTPGIKKCRASIR